MSDEQRAAVIKAVERLKSGKFKATAIKVELEAHLNRGDDDEYDDGEWSNEDNCYNAIMYRLEPLGLSKQGQWDEWTRQGPLKYAMFYNDGSVDSEFTFTLSLKNAADILLLPKIIEAWNDFCAEVGDQEVDGAGMHMALLNNKDCYYPSNMSRADIGRFRNFQKSMRLLLPALYFLGTPNQRSRMLEYRRPAVEMSQERHGTTKFNAITYKDGALEFRVFDTCYDKPNAILDNVVVMANCMKYWTNKYLNPGLDKITKSVKFGNDSGWELNRFYSTVEHIDLLNQGLRRIKPSYYSVKELKAQRNFNANRRSYANIMDKIRQEAKDGYQEYVERWNWRLERYRHSRISDYLGEIPAHDYALNPEQALAQAKARAEEWIAKEASDMDDEQTYINQEIQTWHDRHDGQYTLAA